MLHLTGLRLFLSARQQADNRAITQSVNQANITPRLLFPRVLSIVLALVMTAAVGCGGSSPGTQNATTGSNELAPKKLTFLAGFKPQANLPFVGAYVAQEKGFFRDENLAVDIRHTQNNDQVQLLLAGEVQVSTGNGAQVIKRNSTDLNLVSIALIGQRSEQGFAVLTTSDINSIKDWEGKTFGYKGSVPAEFLAIANAGGADVSKIKQVSVGFDPRVLSEKQVDILPVFFSNEPGTLNDLGVKTKIFDPMDFGVQSLGLTYITSGDYLNKDPDALQRFVKASLRGIYYANDHRDEALDVVLKYAPQEEREHQRFMLNTELDRAQTDLTKKNGIGSQTREQWQSLADTLLQYRGIDKPVDVSRLYTTKFVEASYKDGKLVWP